MPPRPFYRHCPRCGKGFSTFDDHKLYCGDVCELHDKATKVRRDVSVNENTPRAVKCPGCGNYFVPARAQIYCMGYCRNETDQANHRSKVANDLKVNPINKTCPVCAEKFTTNTRLIKYCSKICAAQANREKMAKFREKRSEDNKKAGIKKRRLPYHVLNAMAEKSRLNESWLRLSR